MWIWNGSFEVLNVTGYLDFCPTLPKYFRPTLSHIEMEITQLNGVAKIPDYETGGALPRAQCNGPES